MTIRTSAIRTRVKSSVAILFVTTTLLASQTSCRRSPIAPTVPPLTNDQAIQLLKLWLVPQSPETALNSVSARNETPNSVTLRLNIVDFDYRESTSPLTVSYTGISEAVFKWQRGKWALTRFAIDPGGSTTFRTWDGLYVTDAYTVMAQTHMAVKDADANEIAAISSIRRLVTAELAYLSRRQSTCGTMGDLVREGLMEESYASGNVRGYRFSIRDVGNTCGILAIPRSFGLTGVRSFYAPIADGFIRYTTDGSFPTDKHPRLK